MFHHLNTNRWDLHINQPRDKSCIKHVCCISRMNFYRSDFKHKIYGLYTGKNTVYKRQQPVKHLSITKLYYYQKQYYQ